MASLWQAIACWVVWLVTAAQTAHRLRLNAAPAEISNFVTQMACGTITAGYDGHLPQAYALSMGNNLSWQMTAADRRGQQVLSQLAHIMSLRPAPADDKNPISSNILSKIVFTASFSKAKSLLLEIPDTKPQNKRCASSLCTPYTFKDTPQIDWWPLKFPFLTLWQHPRLPHYICQVLPERDKMKDVMSMMMTTFPFISAAIEAGGLPFHATLACLEGQGILLAGSSGAGKSTCCDRLTPPWTALSDDESLITLSNRRYSAHPFPTWSRFTYKNEGIRQWDVQKQLPLRAICFIEQAARDKLIKIGQGEACAKINETASQIFTRHLTHLPDPKRPINKNIFNNASKLALQIPLFRLQVSRQGKFWNKLTDLVR